MKVELAQVEPYLKDHFEVTNRKTNRFVCPITLKECDLEELINGHILNEKFQNASRRKIVQYGKPDHFYGSRVEPGLIRFLNLKHKVGFDHIRGRSVVDVKLPNGAEFEGFPLKNDAAADKAAKRFPVVKLKDKKEAIWVALKTCRDDPHLEFEGQIDVSAVDYFYPTHWTAAMLKAGYLAMFYMLGYRAVYDPFGDTLRRSLATYFRDNGTSRNAGHYFRDFRNATKILGMGAKPNDFSENYLQADFDTLEDRKILMHFTPLDTIFASTCIFRINNTTVTVTLPQSTSSANVVVALEYYTRLMRNDLDLKQKVRIAQFQESKWDVSGQCLNVHYL